MPTNIEIKARVRSSDVAGLHERAAALSGGPPERLTQEDVFFAVRRGRLKLRTFDDPAAPGELIFYHRPDQTAPGASHYQIVAAPDPAALTAALTAALGVVGVVRKRRAVYLVGQTRVHVDEVDGLGDFAELEVVLDDDQTEADGEAIARELMRRLDLRDDDLVAIAYADMLTDA